MDSMKIAILGFGFQGKSSFAYYSKDPNNQITICDQKPNKKMPEGVVTRLGDDHLKNLDDFDLVLRSPSVHPNDIIAANDKKILEKVTTNTNEFFRVCPSKNIIGVTGTKGKGTTSTLIANILEASGKTVHLGGNIGVSPLDMMKDNIKPDDWVVLELANFQLIDIKYSPPIGVCLMVVPEHMDWHADMDEYVTAKQQMFRRQKSDDVAIYFAKNEHSKEIVDVSRGRKIPYYSPPGAIIENDDVVIDGQSICSTDELKLLGKHNWQNVCAAVTAAWQVTGDVSAMRSVLTTFSGLEHRLEFVREVNGIRYYNDSFASAPDAAAAASSAISGTKVMILGGHDRGLELSKLIEDLDSDIRQVLLIGQAGQRLAEVMEDSGFTHYTLSTAKNIQNIIAQATDLAQPGDTVVFSPGFASFDMFKNFADRGRQFKEAVNRL